MIGLGAQPRILVVALRRLGDVLLATPLIRSLKRAWPDSAIDVLVFAGTEGILAGNPDIAEVITMPERPVAGEILALMRRLWRRYDLALSTQSGDRPTLFAWAAGRRSVGFVDAQGMMARIKWLALDFPVAAAAGLHRVHDVLRLAEAIGISPVPEVIAPSGQAIFSAPLYDEGLFMVDIPTADIRRERIALPLLRDERLELQVRELSRIVAERSGQAIDSNAEPGSQPGFDLVPGEEPSIPIGFGVHDKPAPRPKRAAETATPPARTGERGA